jgi:uncharacterized RDD family membrane protein YckC
MRLASRVTRLIGQFIDGLVAIVPFILLVIVLPPENLDSDMAPASLVFAMLFAVGYYLFADAMPGGQSLGKLMLGMAVVDRYNQAPCTAFQSFVRNIVQPVLGILDWIFILGQGRQRLGDMLAGTIVVEKSTYTNLEHAYAEFDRA